MHDSSNLLETILADEGLVSRLQQLPVDVKTVALIAPDNSFSHPDLITETVALSDSGSVTDSDSLPLPLRHVVALHQSMSSTDPDYRLIGELGRGGTGIVYQAHQPAVDREVAVKKLRSELASNPDARHRFLSEARVIGGLDHPNVIALHEVYVDQSGDLYYSMKRINGTSWDSKIATMSVSQNLDVLLRVANGIHYAHSQGLIHRDIKPENVMLGSFGEVLLADWGLAVELEKLTKASEKQSIGGTPAYMAPELASGVQSQVGKHSDIYLLGATLYQILTGYPPHTGKTLLDCIRNAARNRITPARVDSNLIAIAMKAMRTNVLDRYPTVEGFIRAIKDHQAHEQSSRLERRAADRVRNSPAEDWHRNFNVADALLGEAIDIWPENQRAIHMRRDLQRQHADIARSRGDLDLAATIYESLGEQDSEAALRVVEEQRRVLTRDLKVSRYSTLFIKSPDSGLLTQMGSNRIVECNEAFGELFGYRRDQVVGQEIDKLNLWACPQRREVFIQSLEQKGGVEDFETAFLHRDGHSICVLINSRVATVDRESMMVSTIRDISLRKTAEDELKRSREKLRGFQRLAGLATWSYSVLEDRVYWSTETFALAGRDRHEGTPTRTEFYELVHPDDRQRLRKIVDRAIQTGQVYEAIIRQRLAKGEYENVIVRGQPIYDKNGKIVELYGVLIPHN